VSRPPKYVPDADILDRETKALKLRQAGNGYAAIADACGYTNKGSAHRAVTRALARVHADDAADLRSLEGSRLDEMQRALWPLVLGGDYAATDRLLRIMERRAKLYGLDHADGIAERQTKLDEQNAALLVVAVQRILEGLALTDEQRAMVQVVVPRELEAVAKVQYEQITEETA
jgi:hypothetical protein